MPGPVRNSTSPVRPPASATTRGGSPERAVPGRTGGDDAALPPEPTADADSTTATTASTAPAPAADVSVPIPELPPRPDDRVSAYVEANTRTLPSPEDPEYNGRIGGRGRSVFDVRLDGAGGHAGVATDLARERDGQVRTGERRGSVDVDSRGVHLDAGSNVTVDDDAAGHRRHTVLGGNLDVAPDGNTSGRVSGNTEHTRTTETGSETRRAAGEIRTSIDGDHRADDDIRVDATVGESGRSVHVEGTHVRRDADSTLNVTEDVRFRTDRSGNNSVDAGGTVTHRRTDDEGGTRELTGTLRGTTSDTGPGSLEARGGAVFTGPDGARDAIEAGGTLTATGGTGRVEVDHRRETDTGHHDVHAEANVVVDEGRVSGGGELRGETLRRDAAREVRRDGRVATTVRDDGFTVDLAGGQASTRTIAAEGDAPGRTINREVRGEGRAEVDAASSRFTSRVTGHTETRTGDGTTTRYAGEAGGTVTVGETATRVDGQITGTRTLTDETGRSTTTLSGRGAGASDGDVTGHIEARHDVRRTHTVPGPDEGTRSVTVDSSVSAAGDLRRDGGRVTIDGSRTVTDGDNVSRTVGHGEGEMNTSGLSGRVRAEREVRGPDDARRSVVAEVHGRQGTDGTMSGGGHVTASITTADNRRTLSGTVDGEVRVDAGGVTPSGGVEGDVTTRTDDDERRYRAVARTDGATPTLGLRVENTERDEGASARDNVEANGNLREMRATVLYERERTIDGDGRRSLHVNVDAHPEGFEARVDRPIESRDRGSSRYGGSVAARHLDVSVGVDARTPVDGGGLSRPNCVLA